MTILKYGAYVLPENSTFPTIRRSGVYSETREKFSLTEEWTVRSEILGSGEADLTTKINAFEAAMIDGLDLVLYEEDGVTPTAHSMLDCRVIGGPSYPNATGPEYAVLRTVDVTFQSVTYFNPSSGLIFFRETVTRSGGGPVRIMVPVISGPARRHQTQEEAPYFATQSGTAIGTGLTYPQEPGPLFPGSELRAPDITNTAPVTDGKLYRETSWRYEFGSSQPLIAEPNVWQF